MFGAAPEAWLAVPGRACLRLVVFLRPDVPPLRD
jgi:hypothetical protein